ncbi:MAG: hypothetical protein HON94_03990 [Methylococcales bacterium]|jgi:hypothetical protein|nr:hypothetical protein [Methylococcales bacterium]
MDKNDSIFNTIPNMVSDDKLQLIQDDLKVINEMIINYVNKVSTIDKKYAATFFKLDPLIIDIIVNLTPKQIERICEFNYPIFSLSADKNIPFWKSLSSCLNENDFKDNLDSVALGLLTNK